jgi:Lrp/AsnC family leucine-responsive transcriptional regulator
MERSPDATDWRILHELQNDGRLSYHELGRRVGLSAPATAERVRRMEEAQIITGYRATVNPAKVGLPLTAFVQLRCGHDRCLLKTTGADDYPEVTELHKLSGDYCTLLKLRARSLRHLETIIERIGSHGELRLLVVLSSPLEGRAVAREQLGAEAESNGWHRWGEQPEG